MSSLVVSLLIGTVLLDAPPGFTAGGSVDRSLVVEGVERSYRVYLPRDWSGPVPAVFAFHGEGGTTTTIQQYARFDPIADRRDFVVIYAQGFGKNWDYGPKGPVVRSRGFAALYDRRRGAETAAASIDDQYDDVALVRSIVEELADLGLIDPTRVFATGISSGAMFCHRLAADASDVIAGIAPVSGGMAEALAERFAPEHPVSLMMIIGEDDPLMPVAGGPVAPLLPQDRGRVAAVDGTIEAYLTLNGIVGEANVEVLPDVPEDEGTMTRVFSYPPGIGGTLVEIYRIEGAGHNWPGRDLNYHVEMVGKASQDFDGSEAIWNFFQRCPPRRVEP